MFILGLFAALAVRESWVAWVPTGLFLVYFGISSLDGTVIYDFLILLTFALAPALLGVACGILLYRYAGNHYVSDMVAHSQGPESRRR